MIFFSSFPFLQLLINSVVSGSIYALVAVGFSLIYATNRFMHFAHGAVVVAGGYLLFTLFGLLKLPFVFAVVLAILLSGGLGFVMYRLFYARLLLRKSSTVILLIASIGLLILLENVIVLLFGPQVRTIGYMTMQEGIRVGSAVMTVLQMVLVGVVGGVLVFVFWLMRKTKVGVQLRAVADNCELAEVMGLPVEKLRAGSFFLGSLLAGLAGVLISLEQNISPLMGTMLMVKGFSGAVIGGLLSVPGSIAGSFIVGAAEHFGTWYISSGYKEAITFGLLFLFLLVRPQGIFGKEKGVKG